MDRETNTTLERYAELVAASPHNLVSRSARAELSTRHVPEAVAFAQSLPGPARILDLGSGGGLPGLVIAAVRPDLEVHLLEATGKKAAFLAETAATLGLPVSVHHGRAEDLAGPPLAGTFDIVTARAVAPLERLVGLAAPYLTPGGSLHALKGARWPEELAAAAGAIRTARLRVAGVPETERPDGDQGSDEVTPRVVVLTRA